MLYTVSLQKIAEEFELETVYQSTDFNKVKITVEDVARPGLLLDGFYEHFEPARLLVMGTVEATYLNRMTREQRLSVFDRLFNYRGPALIFARNLEVLPECLEMAQKYDITILRSEDTTSRLISSLISMLKQELAPRITRHGVLVDVYGEGLLLMGDSGIGKSEAAIELVKRGHRIIADDAVEIRKVSNYQLNGTSPTVIRHYVEIRGIGIINVARLFGMGAIKESADIDLIINIVPWEEGADYDRLGLDERYTDMLGVRVPTITMPVTPGRNLAVILEVAAMNNRQKKMGYNAAQELTAALNAGFNTAY